MNEATNQSLKRMLFDLQRGLTNDPKAAIGFHDAQFLLYKTRNAADVSPTKKDQYTRCNRKYGECRIDGR